LAFHQGLEKELATKDDQIWALEQELEAAKKLTEDNEAVGKSTEEQIAKMREDFEGYRKQKREERDKVVAGAQRAANVYKELIKSVGEETEAPSDACCRFHRVADE